MRRMFWVCLLALGILLSWPLVPAADFYVIPVLKCCTCKGTLVGTRWCNNWDGTVTDMTTCLVWLRYADWGEQKPWRSTVSFDDAHTRAGILCDGTIIRENPKPPIYVYLNDQSTVGEWRLPTRKELVGIAIGDESVNYSNPRAFIGIQSEEYWSSTTKDNWALSMAYAVYFGLGGGIVGPAKSNAFYVWPVRDGH